MIRYILSIGLFLICLALPAQRVSVLGDSYSTFEDYVTPLTNEVWYYAKSDTTRTDVVNVRDTWWWQFVKDNGLQLCVNNSYSGATIGFTGYDGNDYSQRSFITRMRNIGHPDIILIFGGTNDSWAGEAVGEYKYAGYTPDDFYTFRPAMAYMLEWLQNHHPNVAIYFIINSELRPDITRSCVEICNHYGISYIMLHDIDKRSGHPTVKGMKAIASQVADVVMKNEQNDSK